MFIFELTLQQPLGLAPSAPKFALLSAEAAAKARPCRTQEVRFFTPITRDPTGSLGLGLPLGNRGKYPAKRDPDVKSSTQKYRYSKGGYC